MGKELEYIGIVQKVSGIHIVPDDILRSCHPVAAVKAGPCTVIPVIGPLSTDFQEEMLPDETRFRPRRASFSITVFQSSPVFLA